MTVVRAAWKVVSWALLLACLASLAGAIWWAAEGKKDVEADIFGYRPYIIATGSEAPSYQVHGFALTHKAPFDQVEYGDVVAFSAAALGGKPALHRVVHIDYDKAGMPVSFVVKGDNNPHSDGAPVTRDNYLGRVVYHTNATAIIWDVAHGPHGLLLVIGVPVALIVLIWIGTRFLLGGRPTRLGKASVALAIAFCLLASAAASYAIYLDKKQDYVTSTLHEHATTYEGQSAANTMTVQSTTVNGTIDIPRIDVHYPVIEYVAASSLDIAITHYAGPGLNQPGNVVLAGHHAWGNLYFTRIDQLEPGDRITITDSNREKVEYVVTGHRQVKPEDTSVLRQTTDGKRHLTLISCTYDLLDRYIVDAVAVRDLAAPRAPAVEAAMDPIDASIWPEHSVPAAIALGALGGIGALTWVVAGVRRRRAVSKAQ